MPEPAGMLALVPVTKKPATGTRATAATTARRAGDALVVEGAGQADQAVADSDVEHPRLDPAGLAPHALEADVGDLALGRASGRDDNDGAEADVGRDLQPDALANPQCLAVGGDGFRHGQRHLGAGAKHIVGRRSDDHRLRSGLGGGLTAWAAASAAAAKLR